MEPTKEQLQDIAAKQEAREHDRRSRRNSTELKQENDAATLIQKNYRGYRERRQLQGMGLGPSTRWVEAVKEARWRNTTKPHSRSEFNQLNVTDPKNPGSDQRPGSNAARRNWRRVSEIAKRAGGDDTSDSSGSESLTPSQKEEHRRQKQERKREREKTAKIMDLQYFLEMVDTKHRYGSHLRAYHSEWKKADTNENFFYWLDKGEGRYIEVPTVSREKLERDQVRYLSREERLNYLVKINKEGRLCWARNGERISTNTEWKDSVHGIVPKSDTTPTYRDAEGHLHRVDTSSSSSSSSSDESGNEEADHYTNHDLDNAKGIKKIRHVSAATVFNHLLRRSVKPNSWIFVADTSFRLYVGIKQSGAFQHSSFLHGARISAAGLIKIKNGQLRRLSPLSGHYRPPASNFRAFVHSLKDEGCDMSRVSISRSYAILVGLETYVKARKKLKHGVEHTKDKKEEVLHPDEVKRKQEAEQDKSESAKKERELLAEEQRRDEENKKQLSVRQRVMKKLGFGAKDKGRENDKEKLKVKDIGHDGLRVPGEGPETGIAPEGRR